MPKRQMTGVVTSNSSDKTVVAVVAVRKTHPLYKKKYTSTKKFYIHDEKNLANVGDTIRFIESIPMSKTKRWALEEVMIKAAGGES